MYPSSTPSTEPSPTGPLVVVDGEAPEPTLRAALGHLAGVEGVPRLLVVVPVAEYAARRDARRAAGVPGSYTRDHLEREAYRVVRSVGERLLGDAGSDFLPLGAVGRRRDCVRAAVAEYGCSAVLVDVPRRGLLARFFDRADLPAALTRSLPGDVPVVPVVGDTRAVPTDRVATAEQAAR